MGYHPTLGRFLQRDPVEQGANPYEYVASSPTGATDPMGLWKYDMRTHEVIVEKGESLWRLSAELTGKGQNWKLAFGDIDTNIRPGQRLKLTEEGNARLIVWDKARFRRHVVGMTWEEFVKPRRPATAPTSAPAQGLFGNLLNQAKGALYGAARAIATGLAWLKAQAAVAPTKASAQCRQFIKSYEKLRLRPYDDHTGRELTSWKPGATIGWGHLIEKSEWKKFRSGISETDAEALFHTDVRTKGEEAVNELVTGRLSQQQYDALVVLVFNIGEAHFAGSTVRKIINDPRYKSQKYRDLESAWKAWNKSRGRAMRGLVNRREDEWEIWSKGDYKRDY